MTCKEAFYVNRASDRLSSSAAVLDGRAAAGALAVPRAVEAVALDAERAPDAVPVVDAVVAPPDGTQAADVRPLAVDVVELVDGTPAPVADEAAALHEPRVAGATVAPHALPQQADGMLPEHAVPQRQGARFAPAPDAKYSAPDALPELHAALAPDSPNARNWACSSVAQAHGWCSQRCG